MMAKAKKLKQVLPELWRIYSRLWPWTRKQRGRIVFSLFALLLTVGMRLLEPWPLKFILDRVIPVGAEKQIARLPLIESFDTSTLLVVCAAGLIVIIGIRALCEYCSSVGFALVGNRVLRDVRNHVFRHMQQLSPSFYDASRGGDLVIRVTRDVSLLRDVTATALLPLLASSLILLGMVVVMLWLEWRLTLLALITVPFFWLTTVRLGRRIHDAARKQRRREGAMAGTAAEAINAIRVVQALSLEDAFAEKFSARNKESQKEDMKAARLSARLGRTVDVLMGVGTALVLWYGTRLVLAGDLTPGDLVVFLTYLRRSFHPVQDLAKYTGRLAKASAAGHRVLDLLNRQPEIHDSPGAISASAFRGTVEFDSVSFGYQPDRFVLNEICFSVEPGQLVALTGESGIGKSTVLSLILRLYDPAGGRVMIDGRDIRDYRLASLRSQISVVMQDSILFADSVWQNIGYAAPGATRDEIEAAARLANAYEFIADLPDGFDTVLGERGVTLSHGQRQRIAIARAAVRRSHILLLDEPTVGLDEENERSVVTALQRLAEGHTTFLITHNLQLAARADRILHLAGGRILEQGAHDELMRDSGRYAELFRLQSAGVAPAEEQFHARSL